MHVHKHCWRHRFGDTAVDRHICPGQLSQQLAEARPDSTVDLKVSRVFALETTRNQELVSSIEMRFLELICLNVTQYPHRCVLTCSALCFHLFYFPRLDAWTVMWINLLKGVKFACAQALLEAQVWRHGRGSSHLPRPVVATHG